MLLHLQLKYHRRYADTGAEYITSDQAEIRDQIIQKFQRANPFRITQKQQTLLLMFSPHSQQKMIAGFPQKRLLLLQPRSIPHGIILFTFRSSQKLRRALL